MAASKTRAPAGRELNPTNPAPAAPVETSARPALESAPRSTTIQSSTATPAPTRTRRRAGPDRRPVRWLPLGISGAVHGSLLLVLVLVYAAVPAPLERRGAFQTVAFVEPCVDEACEVVADELPEEDPVDDLELTPLVAPDDVTPEDDTELPLVEPERAVLHEPPTLAAHEIPLSAVKRREPKPVARPRPTRTPQAHARPVARPVQARPASQARGRTKLKLVSRPSLLSYYPAEARRQGIEGEALVEILVDASGTVTRATLVRTSGSALLDRQAVKVMYAYRFEPGARGRARVPVSFRLR